MLPSIAGILGLKICTVSVFNVDIALTDVPDHGTKCIGPTLSATRKSFGLRHHLLTGGITFKIKHQRFSLTSISKDSLK